MANSSRPLEVNSKGRLSFVGKRSRQRLNTRLNNRYDNCGIKKKWYVICRLTVDEHERYKAIRDYFL